MGPGRDLGAGCGVRAVLGAADSGWNLQINDPARGRWLAHRGGTVLSWIALTYLMCFLAAAKFVKGQTAWFLALRK